MQQTDETKSKQSQQTSAEFFQRLTELSDVQKVKELSSLFFTIDEIAIFINVDAVELRNKINFEPLNSLSIAYKLGRLMTKIQLRHDTRRFALAGSPAAEEDMMRFLSEQIMNEKCEETL